MSIPISLKSMGRGLGRSLVANYLHKRTGLQPIQPTRIQAIYAPVWLIDADIEVRVWIPDWKKDGETMQRNALVIQFGRESYLPGFIHEPLSRIVLAPVGSHYHAAFRFSKDLRRQHDTDILCIPFAFTPLHVLDIARSLSIKDATLSDKLRFYPPTVKANLFAAYPVLLPVYLAQYDIPPMLPWKNGRSFTAILAAHSRENDVIIEDSNQPILSFKAPKLPFNSPRLEKCIRMLQQILSPRKFEAFGRDSKSLESFTDSYLKVICWNKVLNEVNDTMRNWINQAIANPELLRKYQARFSTRSESTSESTSDWDDYRIRELTLEESAHNAAWLSSSNYLQQLKTIQERDSSVADAFKNARKEVPADIVTRLKRSKSKNRTSIDDEIREAAESIDDAMHLSHLLSQRFKELDSTESVADRIKEIEHWRLAHRPKWLDEADKPTNVPIVAAEGAKVERKRAKKA